jgi:predicted protein tyrosine phosphatase
VLILCEQCAAMTHPGVEYTARSVDLIVEVCSREEAGQILSSPSRRAGICYLVSIGDPYDRPPAGYAKIRNKLRLLFADSNEDDGPDESDVRKIIATAESRRGRAGRVLVHCAAGISRSSAAAVILQTAILGAGSEEDVVRRVIEQRPIARPNRRMIAFADALLKRDGKLIAAVETLLS